MAGISTTLPDIVRFLEKHWFEKSGLVTAIVAIAVIEAYLLTVGKASWWVTIIVLIASVISLVVVWWISRRPPKTPKGKVGFLVSIACADDEESEKLREDFVIPLRQLVKSGRAGGIFHFIELPQHLARNILEADDAQSLRIRSRSHFMIYGRVRLRKLGGKDHHVIDLEGIVAHNPIPDSVKQSFEHEFAELLPRRVRISTENDLWSFQFTSEWADIVARYIIGIAAAYSGDLDYAEKLYNDALERLNGKNPEFPVYLKLTERIPVRVSELYETRAFVARRAWVDTHDASYIDELGSNLGKVLASRRELPLVLNLSAIHAFLKDRDTDGAITYLKKSKSEDLGVLHYNMAFLDCYKGDLRSAIRRYRQAIMFTVEPDVISQIEDFMCWVLELEPGQYQLHYCLGFFNWKTKGDEIQAKKILKNS